MDALLKILLIEDNDDHAELVIRNFQNHRIANRIARVKDGEEALGYLFKKEGFTDPELYPVPDLILLDLRLPKIDGITVLKEVKADEDLRKIPVVVLTTSDSVSDLEKSYSHYVNSYLVKPLDFDKFTKLMEDLGYYWLIWNRHPFNK